MTTLVPNKQGEITKGDSLEIMLVKRRDLLSKLMPEGMDVDRFIKMAVLARYRSPHLQGCDTASVVNAVLVAAEVGLDCSGGPFGHGYLVPFSGTATFIPGYRGLVSLARRATGVEIESRCVFEGDRFDYSYGTEPRIDHIPCGEDDDAKITASYAIARPKHGPPKFEVMTRGQIDRIRRMSKQPNGMLWKDHFHEAARKTVTRRLIKWCELMGDDERGLKALEADNSQFDMDPDSLGDGMMPEPQADPIEAVKAKVNGGSTPVQKVVEEFADCPKCGDEGWVNSGGNVVCARCGVVTPGAAESEQEPAQPPGAAKTPRKRTPKPKPQVAPEPALEPDPDDRFAWLVDQTAGHAHMDMQPAEALVHTWLAMVGAKPATLKDSKVWANVKSQYDQMDWSMFHDG